MCLIVLPMTHSADGRRVPADSFRIRLAIVRTEMGWNYDQAEAATGVGSESWRTWEKGLRHCTDITGVSRKIAEVTPYDLNWLALGGPLAAEVVVPEPRPSRSRRRASTSAVRVAAGNTVTSRRARTGDTDRYLSSPVTALARRSRTVAIQSPLVAQVA